MCSNYIFEINLKLLQYGILEKLVTFINLTLEQQKPIIRWSGFQILFVLLKIKIEIKSGPDIFRSFPPKSCREEKLSAIRSLLRHSDVLAFASEGQCRRRHLQLTSVGKNICCRKDTRPEKTQKFDRNVKTDLFN